MRSVRTATPMQVTFDQIKRTIAPTGPETVNEDPRWQTVRIMTAFGTEATDGFRQRTSIMVLRGTATIKCEVVTAARP